MPNLSLSLSSPPNLAPPSFLNHPKLPSLPSKDIIFNNSFSVQNLREAISKLDPLVLQNTPQQLVTYSNLLKGCIRSRSFQLGKLLHQKLIDSGVDLDSVLLNSLVSLYSKCGDWEKANQIFEGMGGKRDLVSWSAMISCFANNGMELEAIATFLDMLENGLYPNEYCFTAALLASSNAQYFAFGEMVFGFLIKSGHFDSDVCVGCSLIDMFVKGRGDMYSALKVFDKMPERNVVSWTLMITRLTQMGFPRDAVDLFLGMLISGYTPDRFTLTGALSASAKLELLSFGQQMHTWVIKSGFALDVCVGCSLVDMYAKCVGDGSLENSMKVFMRMLDHNVMSWTAIITGYVQSGGQNNEAIELFCKMLEGNVEPNHFTYSSVLKACANLSYLHIGEQLHGQTIKIGLSSVNCVGNSLINMYARSARMEQAQKAFDVLFERNLISYNTIVSAYAKNLMTKEAFEVFYEIDDSGFGTSSFTFASLLSGAANVGAIGKGEQIHALVIKSGNGSDLCINNALISMYSRCGNIEAALQVFGKMGDRNVISWTSMITGFAKHGFATKALEMFHEMTETDIKPNEVTYIAVLSACSHSGLIAEGWKYFNSMHQKHGISPRMEHYACMLDLLGRSGSLSEAIEFINSMPFKADALVWRTFLGSCRVHGNTELGEHAAKMIIEKEPHDPAAHVLLSNLYASNGQWEDVARIRKQMKEKNLIKEAGCSWIEVENVVHKFHVGDTSHAQARRIYDELDKLALKIKKLGYVPTTDFVLHDVEDEQKEQYLLQHSEKIAVAFGLLSTSNPKPIRVFKNLRICGDCHSAIKYISMATARTIIVRDANRFHHFKDGICSCNDYW